MSISVHDNVLTSYTVDAELKLIVLRTVYYSTEEPEITNVIFNDVEIYFFEGDNFKNIIFDIREEGLEYSYDKNFDVFDRLGNYGWPPFAYLDKADLLRQMVEKQVKAFQVSSSYGLHGWVWARKMEFVSSRE